MAIVRVRVRVSVRSARPIRIPTQKHSLQRLLVTTEIRYVSNPG